MKSHPKCWKKNKETVAGRGIKKKVESDYYTNTRFFIIMGNRYILLIRNSNTTDQKEETNTHLHTYYTHFL